jgi:amidase
VAVATGLTSFEVGTDIGGSVRIPAGFCGVFGHKPSFGVIPQRGYLDHVGGGVIDADINVFGPIARSAGDLELLLDVMVGPNPEDGVGWTLALPAGRHARLKDYRVGTWLDDPFCEVDSEVGNALSKAADRLAKAGAQVSGSRPPLNLGDAFRLFDSLLIPAISVSVDRRLGDAISGTHRAWLDLHSERMLMRRVWDSWFQDFDVLLCPVMPMAAFPHDHHGRIEHRVVNINGRPRNHVDTLAWTGLVGVAYLPSTVVPVDLTRAGLPIGVQVVGPFLEDRSPLFVASRLADLSGGYQPPQLAQPQRPRSWSAATRPPVLNPPVT